MSLRYLSCFSILHYCMRLCAVDYDLTNSYKSRFNTAILPSPFDLDLHVLASLYPVLLRWVNED